MPKQTFSFADYEIDVDNRRLIRNGEAVVLKAKTFDVLAFFVENAGRVISKDELLDSVWPDQFVEEANLIVQISALRKVLGDKHNAPRFLLTVPGKGYKFVADVETSEEFVIEEHKISRISVEETETIDKNEAALYDRLIKRSSSIPIAIVAGILLILGIGSIWIFSVVNRSYQGQSVMANGRKISTRIFTAAGGMPERVAISPDGRTLAYSARSRRQESVWVGDVENGHSIQILPLADRMYIYVTFGPDGKYVYLTMRDRNHQKATLIRVSIFGGAIQDLISGVNSPVTFSPDGRSIAFLRRETDGNGTSIMVADVDTGKNERVLTTCEKPEDAVGGEISWSPNGRKIAYAAEAKQGGTALLTVNIADGSIERIGETVTNRIVGVVWQPDGNGLFVDRNTSNDAGDGRIWFVPYPTGEQQQITDDTINYHPASLSITADKKLVALQARSDPRIQITLGGDLQNPKSVFEGTRFRSEGRHGLAIAPDGKILFTANASDSRSIWEMDADGGEQRQLTPTQKDSYDQQLGVTADDRFLVFESNRSGATEIWRANRDGTDLKQLTNGGGNIEPTISPDGMWIIYVAERGGRSELWRVPIEGNEPIQMTSEKSFWPAVSPDGRLIAFVRSPSESGFDRKIEIIPFEGGASVTTFDVPLTAALYNRLRWSPDGRGIIYKDEIEGLWFQDLNKDKPEPIESPDDLRIFQFALSADGKLAYSGGIQTREIVILENPN